MPTESNAMQVVQGHGWQRHVQDDGVDGAMAVARQPTNAPQHHPCRQAGHEHDEVRRGVLC